MNLLKSLSIVFAVCVSQPGWTAVPQQQRAALVTLYESTGGNNWTNYFNWLQGDPCDDEWYGVVCNEGKMTELLLDENNLVGSVPSEIGVLTDLKRLALSQNHLYGKIPEEIGQLSQLINLYLHQNQFSGSIPESFANLTNISSMYLYRNELTGNLPESISNLTNMHVFAIEGNKLSGSLPTSLTQLHSLYFFLYENNALYTPNAEVSNWLSMNSCYQDLGSFGAYICGSDFQTKPPANFAVSGDNSGYTLTWNRTDSRHVGGYQIWVSEQEDGPFRLLHEINDRATTSYITESLASSGTNHYFRLKSFTLPHEENRNLVISDARTSTGDLIDDSWYPMQSGHSGSWYNPAQDGHGLSVEILPGNVAVVYWYVYDNNGNPMWLVGAGSYDGERVKVNMMVSEGGLFPPEFDSQDVDNQFWGTLSLSFTDKDVTHVTWNPKKDTPFLPGHLSMQQFVRVNAMEAKTQQNKDSSQITPAHSGSWFNPEQNGHGLVVETLSNGTGLIYWYVFDDAGNQVWLVGSGNQNGDTLEVAMNSVTGAQFPPEFDSDDLTVTPWGTATLQFSSCNNALFSWQPKASQTAYSAGQMSVQKLTQLAGLTCTD